ncbi:MAG: hypothetical protein C0510_06790 [Erythrobacter sp.]|nr:hypothetical protein [Erythrobacter sp.]
MTAWYNEPDPYAAAWLRNLIAAGHIAPGVVDERKIQDVEAWELEGYTQCHFFAGIGIWSAALRAAGWPDDMPIWTGSCPCQPFSNAGKRKGTDDDRHLWPYWIALIAERRPAIVVGEQVASKDGLGWLDIVSADLEREDYALGAVDLCAAGFGQAHLRQRLYFVGLGIPDCTRSFERVERSSPARHGNSSVTASSLSRLADSLRAGWAQWGSRAGHRPIARSGGDAPSPVLHSGKTRLLDNADWLFCRNPAGEPSWRPVESKPQPMVDGATESLGRVRSRHVAEIEREIAQWAIQYQTDAGKALFDLRQSFLAQALQEWNAGGLPSISSAAVLLTFMRQLAEQGWVFSESLSCESPKAQESTMRVLRRFDEITRASCRQKLEEQRSEQSPNALCVLSSILARHASQAWSEAYETYASLGFPLRHGVRNRAGKLRAYGNGLDFATARGFCEAVAEIVGIRPVAEFDL